MNKDIEELEALLEKATPGPWYPAETGPTEDIPVDHITVGNTKAGSVCRIANLVAKDRPLSDRDRYNAAFIAAARNLLPTLLQALKDKDAEIERLRKALSILEGTEDKIRLAEQQRVGLSEFDKPPEELMSSDQADEQRECRRKLIEQAMNEFRERMHD